MFNLQRQLITGIRGPMQNRFETREIVKQVSDRLYLPEDTIMAVYKTLIEVLEEGFFRQEKIILRGFGTLKGRVARVARTKTYKIHFRPSNELRSRLKKEFVPMEKYGVELNNEAVLLAKITGKCPTCKEDLIQKEPPQCKSCGTKPFESKGGE